MTLSDFKNILLSADPDATKRWGAGKGNYTVWTPGRVERALSDDTGEEKTQIIYIDRFTKLDNDPVVEKIWNALENAYIPFEYEQDTEIDTKYIHHIFTCYVNIN